MPKTRKQDAESIVGKDEAEKIDMAQKASTQRSDVLVEMAETEEETQELIAEVEAQPEPEPEVKEEPTEEEASVLASSTDPRGYKETEKSEVTKSQDEVMAVALNEPYPVASLPYGGATSMREAESYVAARNEMIYLSDMWMVFSNVVWNIMDRPDVVNKRSALNSAVDEFKNVLTAKAMLTFSQAQEGHPLQPAIDKLLEEVDNSIGLPDIQKAEILNPALQELGMVITDYTQKSVSEEPPANNENILDEIRKLVQPIQEAVQAMDNRIGMVEAKSQAQAVQPQSRIPQPRTATRSVIAKTATEEPKPGSLKAIARKSVGLS